MGTGGMKLTLKLDTSDFKKKIMKEFAKILNKKLFKATTITNKRLQQVFKERFFDS